MICEGCGQPVRCVDDAEAVATIRRVAEDYQIEVTREGAAVWEGPTVGAEHGQWRFTGWGFDFRRATTRPDAFKFRVFEIFHLLAPKEAWS